LVISNALIGAVLALMYLQYSNGWDPRWAESPDLPSAWPLGVAEAACFGAIVPTSIGLVAARRAWGAVRRWWLLVAVGPLVCSLLVFVMIWAPQSQPIFIAVAALGGSGLNFLALHVAGLTRLQAGQHR
jgi:hypothetical protein